MLRTLAFLAALLGSPALAAAAEPIEGVWTLDNGETVEIAPCGEGYCTTVRTGLYAGKQIGRMAGSGNSYAGTVIDPSNDKTYDGRVEIAGSVLTLTGCVARIFCRSQQWTR